MPTLPFLAGRREFVVWRHTPRGPREMRYCPVPAGEMEGPTPESPSLGPCCPRSRALAVWPGPLDELVPSPCRLLGCVCHARPSTRTQVSLLRPPFLGQAVLHRLPLPCCKLTLHLQPAWYAPCFDETARHVCFIIVSCVLVLGNQLDCNGAGCVLGD